jgi:hypothetical protein
VSREWKPGDVVHTGVGGLAFRTDTRWVYDDDSSLPADDDAAAYRARPLAVIDPEDFQSLLSIVQAMGVHRAGEVITGTAERLQAALREIADPKPPKPAEPTGLGAVVKDAKGDRWVWMSAGAEGNHWWRVGMPAMRCGWSDIDAVRVLSEGVQP